MPDLGVHVYEQATSVSTPVVAQSGVPYFVGLAPVQTAANNTKVNTPILATSWDEAVEKLGFSKDWASYTLCEAMYSHFQLFGCQPALFCNVLDPATHKKALEQQSVPVTNHRAALPFHTIATSLTVTAQESPLTRDVDYTVLYDQGQNACILELLSTSDSYQAETLSVTGEEVTPEAISTDEIVVGISAVDACMSTVGLVPDLICAPAFSHDSVVAAIMATKAAGINGLFRAKALIDLDSSEEGVRQYSDLPQAKADGNLVDVNQILCWPMVALGEYRFHMSTQLAGLMAQVDTQAGGVPYESPSNKTFQMDSMCLADGSTVSLTFEQTNLIASYGIVTALNFMGLGWVCRNSYTACYPANTDVKDYFIPVSRMFDWVGNTLIKTFWSKLDKPMTRRFVDSILDSCNIWLAGLVGSGYLLGARAELLEAENPLTDLMAGIVRIHIYLTPPSPAQKIDFTLEYDASYVTAALSA